MKKDESVTTYWCDVCGHKINILIECPVCNRELCYICSNQLYDIYNTDVCPKCLENPQIKAKFMKEHGQWNSDRMHLIHEMRAIVGAEVGGGT